MLTEIEWGVQNGPIKKNAFLPVTSLFFQKFCFSLRTAYKNVPTIQMSVFILFKSVGVLFEGAFSL